MPPLDLLLAFAVASFLLIVVPGPSVLFVVSRALAHPAGPLTGRRTWWEGFVVGVTNPKTAVFFAAVLPQFVDCSAGHASLQMLVLSGVFALLALASDSGYGVAAGAVPGSRAQPAGWSWSAGLTMVGLGVGLALTGRTD